VWLERAARRQGHLEAALMLRGARLKEGKGQGHGHRAECGRKGSIAACISILLAAVSLETKGLEARRPAARCGGRGREKRAEGFFLSGARALKD
jgi:hypothetical protein